MISTNHNIHHGLRTHKHNTNPLLLFDERMDAHEAEVAFTGLLEPGISADVLAAICVVLSAKSDVEMPGAETLGAKYD